MLQNIVQEVLKAFKAVQQVGIIVLLKALHAEDLLRNRRDYAGGLLDLQYPHQPLEVTIPPEHLDRKVRFSFIVRDEFVAPERALVLPDRPLDLN